MPAAQIPLRAIELGVVLATMTPLFSVLVRAWRRRSMLAAAAGALLIAACVTSPAMAGSTDPLDLSKYRGKVVYLDFWASWCGPCKLSFPFMEKLAAYYAHDNFVIVGVNLDHSRDKADAFLSQVRGTIPVIYDPAGAVARRFGVKEMPTSVLIGPDGRVRYVHNGFFPDQMPLYEAHISELLNGQ